MSGNKRLNMIYKTYIHFALISCLALLTGCVNVEIIKEPVQKIDKVFYADMENNSGTKTVLGAKDSLGLRTIYWSPEDSIGVAPVTAASCFFDIFKNTKTELSDRAVFEGKTEIAQDYVAIYPYDENTILESGSIYFELDAVQKYVEGTFDQGAFPMIAKLSNTDENILKFLNLCGILEINLKGEEKIESITFSSHNNISGLFCVSLDYETYPEIKASGSNTHNIKLDCGDGVQLDASSPTSFYLVLPPADYQSFSVLVRTTDGKLMNKQSTKPLTITRSRLTTAGALAYVESVSIDLSLYGTSNCYVVPSIGMYKFNASVIGNGEYGFVPDAEFHTSDPNITPSLVEVLWETKESNVQAEKGEIVADVTLTDDGYVDFFVTGAEGNASVAVMDADSTILWSWHLWVISNLTEQVYKTNDGATTVMLDRNIGALENTNDDISDNRPATRGAYYQWGRKDPFIHSCLKQESLISTLQVSVTKPNVMLINGDVFGGDFKQDWMAPVNEHLWQSGVKTIYDPCPVGYRIANTSALKSLSSVDSINEYGFKVTYDGENTSWFPQTGFYTGGHNRKANDDASYLWISEYCTYFQCQGMPGVTNAVYRSVCAMPVRCMRENIINVRLATDTATNVTESSADIHGSMGYLAEANISEMGFVWSNTSSSPDINCSKVCVEVSEGDFSHSLTDLTPGTTYYVRTYAAEEDTVVYGNVISFTTTIDGDTEELPGEDYEW